MAAITAVMRAQQIFQARVDEVLRPFELTFARYELLMLLHFSSRGSLPIKKASERLQVHPTSITNAVDRLEAAGLVERRPHPTDGRATLIEITDSGRSVALDATARLNASEALLTMLFVGSVPAVPPSPNCSVPLLTVVRPL